MATRITHATAKPVKEKAQASIILRGDECIESLKLVQDYILNEHGMSVSMQQAFNYIVHKHFKEVKYNANV